MSVKLFPSHPGTYHRETVSLFSRCLPTCCASKQEKRKFVRRYVFRSWGAAWCSMLRENMFACVQDTREGVRRPRSAAGTAPVSSIKAATGRMAVAPTEPYPALRSPSGGDVCPHGPIELGSIDTPINTPVVEAPVP